MKKLLLWILLLIPFCVKAQTIVSQPQIFQKYVHVKGSLFSDSTLLNTDSTNRVATTAWVKRNGGGSGGSGILNQTTLQPSSNFNISDTGRAEKAFKVGLFTDTTHRYFSSEALIGSTPVRTRFGNTFGVGVIMSAQDFIHPIFGIGALYSFGPFYTDDGGNTNYSIWNDHRWTHDFGDSTFVLKGKSGSDSTGVSVESDSFLAETQNLTTKQDAFISTFTGSTTVESSDTLSKSDFFAQSSGIGSITTAQVIDIPTSAGKYIKLESSFSGHQTGIQFIDDIDNIGGDAPRVYPLSGSPTQYAQYGKVDSLIAAGGGGATIYTGDGILTGDRTVAQNANTLTFSSQNGSNIGVHAMNFGVSETLIQSSTFKSFYIVNANQIGIGTVDVATSNARQLTIDSSKAEFQDAIGAKPLKYNNNYRGNMTNDLDIPDIGWVDSAIVAHSGTTIYTGDGTIVGNRTINTNNHFIKFGDTHVTYILGNIASRYGAETLISDPNSSYNGLFFYGPDGFVEGFQETSTGHFKGFEVDSAKAIFTNTINGAPLTTDADTSQMSITPTAFVTNEWVLGHLSSGGGSGITNLTGDGTASGPGSAALTLATVNSSPGTFGDATHVPTVTVNGKGLATTVTSTAITFPVTASNSVTFTNKSGNISQWTNDSGYITSAPTAANPTASVGGSPVNGSAITFMRSDAAPKADTSVLRTAANSRTLAQTQTALNLKANLISPSFTTPTLGTPASGVATNITGLPLTTGVTGILPIANGGTNISTYTTGDLPYASATNVLSKLGIGGTGTILTVSGGIPSWSNSISVSGNINSGAGSILTSIVKNPSSNTGLYLQFGQNYTTAGDLLVVQQTNTHSSGVVNLIDFTPTNNETGSAGTIGIKQNWTNTAVGSGTQEFADWQIGGVSKFSVSITGLINSASLTASKVVFTDASKNLTSTGIGTSSQYIAGDGSLGTIGSKPHTIFTPTTGGTVALTNNQYNIINPAGALLALTVNLPSSPANNDCVFIKFTQNVTTVTYGNGTVVDGITAPTAGGLTVLTYDSGTTSWY